MVLCPHLLLNGLLIKNVLLNPNKQQASVHLCKPDPNVFTMYIDCRLAAFEPLTAASDQAVFAQAAVYRFAPTCVSLGTATIRNVSNTQSYVNVRCGPAKVNVYLFCLGSFLSFFFQIHGQPWNMQDCLKAAEENSTLHNICCNKTLFITKATDIYLIWRSIKTHSNNKQ